MVEKLEAEDPNFEILFDPSQIKERVNEIAHQISEDYKEDSDTPLVLIGVLKGATPFFIDLFRSIKHPNLMMDFVGVSSYYDKEISLEKPKHTYSGTIDITGKHVVLTDDIMDTGKSIDEIINSDLLPQKPKSIKICTLLSKPERREIDIPIDYLGFTIPDLWVQGYGLDSNERGRNWPYIAYKKKV